MTGVASSMDGVSRVTGGSGLGQRANGSGLVQRAPPNVTPINKASTNGIKCFGYGENGHRQIVVRNRVRGLCL